MLSKVSPNYVASGIEMEPRRCNVFTSRKAGQHMLLVQGTGEGHLAFLETSVHVQPETFGPQDFQKRLEKLLKT